MPRAVVIGGGIGGLTAGIALRRKGWEVTVLERAPRLEPVGAGVAVAANALKALDAIGVGDRVRKLSRLQGQVGLRSPDGRWLTRTTEDKAREKFGDSVVILHRATLVDVLVDALGADALRLGTTVTSVERDSVRTADGVRAADGVLEADLIVAADGIHSATRAALFPAHPGPVYAGVTAWRGLVPALDREIRSTETWGMGLVFGAHQMDDELIYYYATDLSPAGATHGDEREELLRRFGGWHDPIPDLIRASENDRILRNDLYYFDRPLEAMHRGRVALLGDAAHPMTPNLGQGACQAIEDAIVLAMAASGELASEELTSGELATDELTSGESEASASIGGDVMEARLAAYTAARLERTAMITRQAMNICRATKLRNPLAVGLRDAGMKAASRLTPDLMLRSMEQVLGWRPPAPVSSGPGPAARG
ncbi:FAD-dependent monooxygenase [Nonomuraea rhizosphaerae]|uniref:FAD-dependent monooxygenase n=1 Tax=Nonomuraea rhizosphaerae TaxID=2665663 RepID=UPI001C6036AA|nr:FAD-dependent monooxygenase [Nonomuraea rhizosphaerae]